MLYTQIWYKGARSGLVRWGVLWSGPTPCFFFCNIFFWDHYSPHSGPRCGAENYNWTTLFPLLIQRCAALLRVRKKNWYKGGNLRLNQTNDARYTYRTKLVYFTCFLLTVLIVISVVSWWRHVGDSNFFLRIYRVIMTLKNIVKHQINFWSPCSCAINHWLVLLNNCGRRMPD